MPRKGILNKIMPKKKINQKTLAQYKKSLVVIKEDILNAIKKISDNTAVEQANGSGDVSGHALHMADVATDMYDREFSLGLASNDRELLHKVDEALVRIEDNTYGTCLSCDKPIAVARLKAVPYAENCLACQEKIDGRP